MVEDLVVEATTILTVTSQVVVRGLVGREMAVGMPNKTAANSGVSQVEVEAQEAVAFHIILLLDIMVVVGQDYTMI